MDRFIDSVMLTSDRVDERARLITRLCDTIAPLVGDLGPSTPELIRSSLLGAMRQGHRRPFDVVADVLERLSAETGHPVGRHTEMTPGEALALGVCDGLEVCDYALGAAVGIDRDEIAVARDAARLVVGLPPAPPTCTARHGTATSPDGCITCMLVRADAATAHARVVEHDAVPRGLVVERVVASARTWQRELRRPRHRPVGDGPNPWVAVVAGMAAPRAV